MTAGYSHAEAQTVASVVVAGLERTRDWVLGVFDVQVSLAKWDQQWPPLGLLNTSLLRPLLILQVSVPY